MGRLTFSPEQRAVIEEAMTLPGNLPEAICQESLTALPDDGEPDRDEGPTQPFPRSQLEELKAVRETQTRRGSFLRSTPWSRRRRVRAVS